MLKSIKTKTARAGGGTFPIVASRFILKPEVRSL
jgi:hypothetical protein